MPTYESVVLEVRSVRTLGRRAFQPIAIFLFADAKSKKAERLPNKFPVFSPSFAGGNTLCSRSRTGRKGSAFSEKLFICSA